MRGRVGVAAALLLLLAGGRARSSAAAAGAPKDTVTIGAALSLTGSLSHEGVLTREGYDRCAEVVNRKGGVHVGDRSYRLALRYQDDQSTPDVASRLVEQMNSSGIKLLLGPYGSASTEAAAAIVKQSKELGLSPAGGFGETVAPATPDFVRTLGKSAEGVLGSAQWTPDVPGHDDWFGTAADYAAGFKTKFGRDAVYHNAEASAA